MIINRKKTETDLFNSKLINEAMINACACSLTENVSEIIQYHIKNSGGQTRAKVSLAASQSLGISPSDALCAASAVELLHNASLVHDDIQDKAEYRRGKESLWKKFGTNSAICAGDLMISAAFNAITTLENKEALGKVIETMHRRIRETITGQFSDLSFNVNDDITVEQYESVAAGKSSPLIGLAIELPLIIAGYEELSNTIDRTVVPFAVAYQMLDDLTDIEQDEYSESLNIVNLHRRKLSYEDSIRQTSQRIEALIKDCEKSAMTLPKSSGEFLVHCAAKLKASLSQVCHA